MHHADNQIRLRIGELAGELGINPKTIRYYEEIGLLPSPTRSEAGYRLYDGADRQRLEFIAKAKATGLTLEEIGEILALRREGKEPCTHVLTMLDQKLEAVDQQLRALIELREELVALRRESAATVRSGACVCGVIEHHVPKRGEPRRVSTRPPLRVLIPSS